MMIVFTNELKTDLSVLSFMATAIKTMENTTICRIIV